jgi:hypothetical protein
MPLEDDLYRSLVEESKLYREKVSTIWLQKFTTLGAIITFAATRSEAASKNPESNLAHLIAVAILSLPVVAVLLDIKLGEFGIHARVIDNFIIRRFPNPPVLAEWERTKWGDDAGPDHNLILFRSISTVASTMIPTCVIAFLSVLIARPYVGESTYRCLHIAMIGFCSLYLVGGIISGPMILFRRQTSRNNKH